MSAGQLCSRMVVTAAPDESVLVAARRMKEKQVGTVVVVRDRVTPASQHPNLLNLATLEVGGRVVEAIGIITDRDIALRCVAAGLDPEKTPVTAVMTQPVRVIDEKMELEDIALHMADAGARRLIVTGDKGELVGILTFDDLLALVTHETTAVGRLLGGQRPHSGT